MGYLDIYGAATESDSPLRRKVAVAVHLAVVDVLNEDPGHANHANRIAWARRIAHENIAPTAVADAIIWQVLEDSGIAADPLAASDADVQTMVDSLVDRLAGT